MIKIIHYILLLFLICFVEIFSQGMKSSNLFSDGLAMGINQKTPSYLFSGNKLSSLHTINTTSYFVSIKTHSTKTNFSNIDNRVIHHPLVYAKLNFFGIDNLKTTDDVETTFTEEESSFWDNEIVYFVIGAVAATALYIVWQNSGSENPPQKTFGLPPKPQSVYGQ